MHTPVQSFEPVSLDLVGVDGRLHARAARYAVERELGTNAYGTRPRTAAGRADYRAARALLTDGATA